MHVDTMENSNYHRFITPSSTCLSEDLLFFDTFSHSSSDKDNFDLVQFPSPVVIDLIKIIPLGQPIEAKIPGNVRLGATNPSKCELEFFINDLTKQDAHTMTDLGKFYCNEKETDFNPPIQVQTDGLLLRGSYRTLTLAIFGRIVAYDEKIDDDQVILSAASPPAQTPASPVEEPTDRDMPYLVETVDREMLRGVREESESIGEESISMKLGCEIVKNNSATLADNNYINDDAMMEEPAADLDMKDHATLDELSCSDVGPTADSQDQRKVDQNEYSNLSADLDVHNFNHTSAKDSNKHAHNDNNNESSGRSRSRREEQEADGREWTFNIDTYEIKPLVYFPDPSLTLQERTLTPHRSSHRRDSVSREVEKVMEMFDGLGCEEGYKTDDWVTLIEDLTNDIANMSLSQTVNNDTMLRFLMKQVLSGLDIDLALKQKQTGFKVRHLKAGLKLATLLFHCGSKAVKALLDFNVPQKVLQLYNKNQMSFPLRLLMFRCLSAACDSVEGVEHIINHNCTWDDETDFKLHDIIKNLSETYQVKPSETSSCSIVKFDKPDKDEDENTIKEENLAHQTSNTGREDNESSPPEEKTNSYTCYRYMIVILLTRPTTRVTMAIGNLIKKIRLHHNMARLSATNLTKTDDDSEDSVFDSEGDNNISENMEQSLQLIQDTIDLMKDNCANIAQPVRFLPASVQFHVKPSPNDNLLAIYRCFKHYNILECINAILVFINNSGPRSITQLELSVRLQNACILLIQSILESPRGTQLFMSDACFESTNRLIKTMAKRQTPKRTAHLRLSDCIDTLPSASLCREESLAAAFSRDTSLRLSYCFKIFSCIDKLFDFHRGLISKRDSASNYDPEKVLHQLFLMCEHPYGLAAMMKHFACIGNLDCILRFLDVPDHLKHLEFVKETSIDYALQIVGTFLRLNNNVLEIADEYLDTIIELSKTKDKNFSARIKSLIPWLSPFDVGQPMTSINYSEETFRQLTRVIRKSIPDQSIPFAQGLNFELPPKLITAVRIMRQLCIPPQVESFITTNFDVYSTHRVTANSTKPPTYMPFYDSHQNYSLNLNVQVSRNSTMCSMFDESIADQITQISNTFKLFQPYEESICGDLKFHYGIMQVFEQEGLKRLLNTLRELTSNYPRPTYQSAALSGFRGRVVISFIHSVVILLHSLTCHLIDARGKEFKDTSIIPVILETYSLLCFVSKPNMKKVKELMKRDDLSSLQKSVNLKSDNYQLAQQTKKLILSILMSYTQLCLSVSESEENVISKSMWTRMLKEVTDFTMSAPVFFHHGLDVLTKILPSPLPSPSVMDSIDQEQLFKNINHRKLWSAHLHPLHQRLEQMISGLSICYSSNVRTLLFYLCNQLCDLSSSTACMVAKTITDTLITFTSKLNQSEQASGSGFASTPEHQQQTSSGQQLAAEDRSSSASRMVICGAKENLLAIKVLINLISHLITNQAFRTATTNHLQLVAKKDERILISLQNVLKSHEDYKSTTGVGSGGGTTMGSDTLDDTISGMSGASGAMSSVNVAQVIDSIRLIGENVSSSTTRNGHNGGGASGGGINAAHQGAGCGSGFHGQINSGGFADVHPPEELTRINLLELAHKTSDRFDLVASLSKSYRLKVLLDMISRAHRNPESTSSSSKRFDHAPPYNYRELLVQSSYKGYVAPLRGRGRSLARPDSFRSRPQNTSRPPSIHVDDFVDTYGEHSGSGGRSGSKSSVVSGAVMGVGGGGSGGQQSLTSDSYHHRLGSGGGGLLGPSSMSGSPMLGPPPSMIAQQQVQSQLGQMPADPPSLLHRPVYFSPPQAPPAPGAPPYGSGGGSRSHSKSKHMKLK